MLQRDVVTAVVSGIDGSSSALRVFHIPASSIPVFAPGSGLAVWGDAHHIAV